jgi:hypothetical protein
MRTMKPSVPFAIGIALALLCNCSGESDDSDLIELDTQTTAEVLSDPNAAEADATDSPSEHDIGKMQAAVCVPGYVEKACVRTSQPACFDCICNGYQGYWKRSAWSATTYLCTPL